VRAYLEAARLPHLSVWVFGSAHKKPVFGGHFWFFGYYSASKVMFCFFKKNESLKTILKINLI
jgi:hypothetical protein